MQKINYASLFIITTLGVASGNLLSNYIDTQYAAYETKKVNQKKQGSWGVARELTEEEKKSEKEWYERKMSPKGQKLGITCKTWTDLFQEKNTARTKELMLEHCLKFHTYVRTGR